MARTLWWVLGRPSDRKIFARRLAGLGAVLSFAVAVFFIWVDVTYRPVVGVVVIWIAASVMGYRFTRDYISALKERGRD